MIFVIRVINMTAYQLIIAIILIKGITVPTAGEFFVVGHKTQPREHVGFKNHSHHINQMNHGSDSKGIHCGWSQVATTGAGG
jgi:hypothetical protein